MKRKLCLILSLVLVLTALMAGCSKNEQPVDGEGEQGEKQEDVSDANNPAAKRDGASDTLVIGTSEAKGDFLPGYSSSVYDGYITDLIFEGLISNDKEGNYIKHLAKDIEISEDGKTYTFKLRDDVKFTDGTPLTAKDVEFTYTMLSDPSYDGPRSSYANQLVGYEEYRNGDATTVEGIKVIDDYTISFTHKEPLSTNIWNFEMGIIPKHIYGFEKGNIAAAKAKMLDPIGSGPYKMVKFEQKQYVELIANENYFLSAPKVPKIIIKFTTVETAMSELEKGTIDVQLKLPSNNENKETIESTNYLNINSFPGNSYYYMAFNLNDPRLSDKNVRQALVYGFNRQQFVDVYFQGYGSVCNQPISQVSWAYSDKVEAYEYNPEKASELLEAAGWKLGADGIREKDGQKLDFIWDTYVDSRYVEALIPMLKADWQKIGVKVEANLMDFNSMEDKVYNKREFTMFNMGWSLSADPDAYEIFHSSADVPGGYNAMGFRNAENDRLMEEGRREFDQAKRAEIYKEWAELMNDELPYMFINSGEEWDVINSRVLNFNTSPFQKFTNREVLLDIELQK